MKTKTKIPTIHMKETDFCTVYRNGERCNPDSMKPELLTIEINTKDYKDIRAVLTIPYEIARELAHQIREANYID
jgi:hypothetical protein